MNIPFQQTKAWQKLQEELGEKTIFVEEPDYTFLAIEKTTKFGKYLYLPYGPYLKERNAAKKAYKALEQLARSEKIVFIRVEPQEIETLDFWQSLPNAKKVKDLNPKESWILDLDQPQSEMISNFTQGTRTCYNQFPKKGISVSVTKNPDDIHYLVDLQQKLAKRKNIGIYSEDYLRTEMSQDFASLYLAVFDPKKMEIQPDWIKELEKNDSATKVIASSLFFDYEDTRYYMQSASDNNYRRLPATVAILSTAIFDAKEKGLKKFDFWGIAPEDATKNHPWYGFTKFKKSFGGREIQYCGTFDLVFRPEQYRLYSFARKINRKIRKIARKKH